MSTCLYFCFSATTNYAQTPTDAKYNAHMQFLQQKLSSITMTNQVPVRTDEI